MIRLRRRGLDADDVGAANGHPSAVGLVEVAHFGPEVGTVQDHVGGDNAVGNDMGGAVDVLEETVEGLDALLQAVGQGEPVGGGDNAGNRVNRE